MTKANGASGVAPCFASSSAFFLASSAFFLASSASLSFCSKSALTLALIMSIALPCVPYKDSLLLKVAISSSFSLIILSYSTFSCSFFILSSSSFAFYSANNLASSAIFASWSAFYYARFFGSIQRTHGPGRSPPLYDCFVKSLYSTTMLMVTTSSISNSSTCELLLQIAWQYFFASPIISSPSFS